MYFSDPLTVEVDNEDADTEPEPLAEPECTYKTNDQMNAESWLLVCSTIGCAAAGIGKFNEIAVKFFKTVLRTRKSKCQRVFLKSKIVNPLQQSFRLRCSVLPKTHIILCQRRFTNYWCPTLFGHSWRMDEPRRSDRKTTMY